jgi:putative DNA primase/helicase
MSALAVNFDAIPAELKALLRWVVWKYGAPRPDGKRPKPPRMPNGRFAKSNDPTTWSSFETVKAALLDRFSGYDGIGFVLTSEDGLVGIDLDNCVGDDGTIAPWAMRIMAALPTYWERSPSGRGLRAVKRSQASIVPRSAA